MQASSEEESESSENPKSTKSKLNGKVLDRLKITLPFLIQVLNKTMVYSVGTFGVEAVKESYV